MGRLCHYTTAARAIRILNSGIFIFGKLENANDPFEKLSHRFIKDDFTSAEALDFFLSIDEFINKSLSRACFVKSRNNRSSEYKVVQWAHYANNHSGVCFVFDKLQLIEEVEKAKVKFLHDDINYAKIHPLIPEEIFKHKDIPIPALVEQFGKMMLFTKHSDWYPENEYRIIVFENGGVILQKLM